MKIRRHVRLGALIALSTAATVAIPATASAATTPIVAGGAFARTVPFIDGTIYAYECHAAAPGAASTSINSCNLNSVDGPVPAPPVTTQGPVATTNGAVSTNPALTYQLCWTASAHYSDGSTQSTSGCSTSSSIGGAG